jgi:AbrB family looped-hinge helix DNA binding protein
MGLSKVQARGQVTIPADVRRAAGVVPGETVIIEAAGKGKIQVTALGTHEPLDSVFKRYSGPGAVPAGLWDRVAEAVARETIGRPIGRRPRKQASARKGR